MSADNPRAGINGDLTHLSNILLDGDLSLSSNILIVEDNQVAKIFNFYELEGDGM